MRRLTYKEFTQRFWGRVKKTDSCWLWMGPLSNHGYGSVQSCHFRGHNSPHRIAYVMLRGNIPPRLQIDHLCKIRNCVNPAHMELVTGKVNTLRGGSASARNAIKTHCPRGHVYDRRNTHLDRQNQRHCRECDKLNQRDRRKRRLGAYGERHRPLSEYRQMHQALTTDQRAQVIEMYTPGSAETLAKAFGVSRMTIFRTVAEKIRARRTISLDRKSTPGA